MRSWLALILLALFAGTTLKAQPANDNFTNATPVGEATLFGNDVNASFETGEPNLGATNTVWWSWTATNSGLAFVDLDGSSGNYFVGTFVGYTVDDLALLPSNPFQAVAGITYRIQVSGFGGDIIAISVQPEGMSITDLQKNLNEDSSYSFTNTITVANAGTSAQSMEVDLVARAGYNATALGTNLYVPKDIPPDQILNAYYFTDVAPGTQATMTVSNLCPAPYVYDANNFGIGYVVFAEFKGTYTNSVFLFDGYWPDIPGATYNYYPGATNENLDAYQLVSGIINGPTNIPENSSTNFTVTLTLTNGFITTNVNFSNALWSISPSSSPFAITGDGVFTAGAILTNTVVTLTADFTSGGTTNIIITNVTVDVLPSPVIVFPPTNLAANFEGAAEFSVVATGNAPLHYQWNFDGAPLAGATNSTLAIAAAELADAGSYSVTVSNTLGAATSASAILSLTETAPPTVTILSPNPSQTFTTTDFALAISGTATDQAGVIEVLCAVGTNAYQVATGTSNWSAIVTLSPGNNLISVKCLNVLGDLSSVATANVMFDLPVNSDGLILLTNGDGVIQHSAWPKTLAVGNSYTVTASPKANNVFAGWVGGTTAPYSVVSMAASYKFTMEPNLVLEANFVTNPFIAAAGIYNGLFTNTNGISEQTAGMLKNLSVSQKGTYSGTLLLDGTSEAITGSFNLAGQATNNIPHTSLTVVMTLGGQAPPQLTGTVSNREPSWASPLLAERATNAPFPAEYTMLIEPDPSVAPFILSPGGDGYAVISDTKGTAKITGALPDGTAFTQSAPVSLTGDVPFYASLYHNQGLLLGWINLNPANTAPGSLAWVHPRSGTGLFPYAFISTNAVALSPWTSPPSESLLAGFTNFSIVHAINDTQTATNNVAITLGGNFKLEGGSGSLDLKTGLLTVTMGTGDAKLTAHGVLLPNQTNGGGYFLTLTNAGAIQLGP